MVSSRMCLLAFAAGVAYAFPASRSSSCATPAPTATLPLTGGSTELPDPSTLGLKLKKIAVGHGIQNYTCANNATGTAAAQLGALATLYDITELATTLNNATLFAEIPSILMWSQSLPLNLVDRAAASPGTPASPNALPEASYVAVASNPFPAPAPVTIRMPSSPSSPSKPSTPPGSRPGKPPVAPGAGAGSFTLPWLGRHYFDKNGTPMFDLSAAAGMRASVVKNTTAAAPAAAGTGIIGTGAVPWLYLTESGKGLSSGLTAVYRVATDGGSAQVCSTSGAGTKSAPYTAMYWFYAPA